MTTLSELTQAIKKGDRTTAVAGTTEQLAAGTGAQEILDALLAGMDDVGQRFKSGQAFVPEVLIAARAMKEAMVALEPALVDAGIKPKATAVIGTVQGDLHDIGKNLVAMMLKGANFAVVDLGTNVAPDRFVAAAQEHQASLVLLSALLTTTMPAMKDALQAVRTAGLPAKVMVGGAPVTQDYADEIGADGYSADAASAVDKARELCGIA